jgi:hydrogenase maturation protein HypF
MGVLTRAEATDATWRLRLTGHVQGVGFRPFVYRLAHEFGIAGSVCNLQGEVEILARAPREVLERFEQALLERAPPLSDPHVSVREPVVRTPTAGFWILASVAGGSAQIFIPPDSFTCPQCVAELTDPHDRRYRYPFINCTQCGPRYTLIEALPYDRANTTMAAFPLCPQCAAEYGDIGDRRFHAEPLACARCGPALWLEEPGTPTVRAEEAIARAVALLRAGAVVAVKGVGGYHLLCDARNETAVARLRRRKHRPGKPLAVMYPQQGDDGLGCVRRDVELSQSEARWLRSSARPIVLARRRASADLVDLIAPGLGEIGVLLPYSPLHHLLLEDLGHPVVATSANFSGEPVITDPGMAARQLSPLTDAILHHNRPIARPADDSVVRSVLGRARTVRIGRGLGPLERSLPWHLDHPVLATGGQQKVTVALAWENRVVISPHIGDLDSARGVEVFLQVIEDLQRLYGVRAAELLCDAHPDYAASRWAVSAGLPVSTVAHHRAHASGLAAEHDPEAPMLVFAWDGTGLGEDGTLWGAEAFCGMPGRWCRRASLRPFRLPGGERAGREPWRSAAGICWELGVRLPGRVEERVLHEAWRAGLNAPLTSAAGRLFDAAAALLLGVDVTSYEGEAPMRLEALARQVPIGSGYEVTPPPVDLRADAAGVLRLDWRPFIEPLLSTPKDVARAAYGFHAALAAGIAAVARALRAEGFTCVGLTGGVFQNALLVELAERALAQEGYRVCLNEQVPCNDGGLSFGQIMEYAGRMRAAGSAH